jgi:hypothetical protein
METKTLELETNVMEQFIPLLEELFFCGTYESSLTKRHSKEFLRQAINKGLITAKQDYEWSGSDELCYEITSLGILEMNIWQKKAKQQN